MVTAPVVVSADLVECAYEACARLARDHYENFPVASILVPRSMRRAVTAVYAFARRADDFADEPGYEDAERLARLAGWHDRLMLVANGKRDSHGAGKGDSRVGLPTPANVTVPLSRSATVLLDDLIFIAVGDAIRQHDLPPSLFADLLSAFRQDVTVKRYGTWADVLDYCSRSANPVGRLVLRIAGHRDETLERASDALCTALQLTNFWQDFAKDWINGRLYVPQDDCLAFGARERELEPTPVRTPPAWRAVLREMATRTRRLFDEGRPVCDGVRGRLKYELRLTWLGGTRILERLEAADFELFATRPTLTARDIAPLVWRTASWTRA